MKLKELKRTVNECWSPSDHYPVMLATGSAAQQVDASFSSTSLLELYGLNFEDPGLDLELKCSLETQNKFHKIVWSGAGVIVGGCDGGLLEFYSADKLLNNASDALIGSSTKHSGQVSSLDVNPYQKNLLASGASDSEIFIWDLNNTSVPMAPGNRSQPHDHVQGLAWNQQVQHILGSTFANRCVVWDLRKNQPIMKLSDAQSRTRWRALAWHPSVATQVCIASEDDLAPVIQLWDLRLAASPLMTLEGHQKGVLSLSWSPHDPDLLLSAGKDGRVLCWQPDHTVPATQPLEVWSQAAWVLSVSWSSRVPGVLATAAFDQQLCVHALLAASRDQSTQSTRNIMDSFGGVESFSQLPAVAATAAPRAPAPQPPRAPAWLRRPVGAKMAFGGKLVTFEKCPAEAGPQKQVYISQVVSEPELVERAAQLDLVLGSSLSNDPNAAEQLAEYCRQRGDAATDQGERYTWFFLRANFLPAFRTEVLNLLGFKQDEIPSKFKSAAPQGDAAQPDLATLSRGESTETEAELSTDTSTDLSDAHTLIERKLANIDLDGPAVSNVVIPNGEDPTSLICRALVCGNLEEAVELCLDGRRIADALVIASLGSQELLYKVQKYHLHHTAQDPVSLIAGSLLHSAWEQLVRAAAPRSWRDTLAALVTHCDSTALAHYSEMLGDRLAAEPEPSLQEAATICYLCAMSADRLVARWAGGRRDASALAAATERALLARRAAGARGRHVQEGSKLETVLNEYAFRLAAQGCLQSALNSLEGSASTELKQRLSKALGLLQEQRQQPQVSQFNRNRTFSAQSHKRPSVPHSETNYNTVSSPYDQTWQQSSVPAAGSFPPQNSFPFQPQPIQTQPQPLQPQPLQPQPLQPQTQPPPRPGSVGPQSGGISSRSKYKVDPSVGTAPLYNQYSFNGQQQQPNYGYNSPLPDQYNSTSVPNTGFTALNNNVNPANPVNPMNPVNPAPVNPVNGYYGAPEPAPAPEPARPVAPGWNDPPVPSSKPKPKPEMPAQAPITHPLFGVEPPQHVPLAGPQYGQAGAQQFPGQAAGPPGQYQASMPAPGHYQANQQYHQYAPPPQYTDQMNQQYQQGRESPAIAAQPAPAPVAKKPIPDQYGAMVRVFDSLRAECCNRAAQPQMKRKLEDVQRRMESLYDLLREHRLSETALSTLQTCASFASQGDMSNATAAASSLAAGAEFAAVASFLPALKGLLQLAAQLQVHAH